MRFGAKTSQRVFSGLTRIERKRKQIEGFQRAERLRRVTLDGLRRAGFHSVLLSLYKAAKVLGVAFRERLPVAGTCKRIGH